MDGTGMEQQTSPVNTSYLHTENPDQGECEGGLLLTGRWVSLSKTAGEVQGEYSS